MPDLDRFAHEAAMACRQRARRAEAEAAAWAAAAHAWEQARAAAEVGQDLGAVVEVAGLAAAASLLARHAGEHPYLAGHYAEAARDCAARATELATCALAQHLP